MEDLVLSCLESRVEENRNLYARFLVGPFLKGDALTVATALRRVLLSSVEDIGITALYIQGITHEFSTIVGVRESVLELSLNFQSIVLCYDKMFFQEKSFFDDIQIGYLQVQGPKTVYANHLKLPLGIKLVDPTQYIATVSKEGSIVLKFVIGKKNKMFHQTTSFHSSESNLQNESIYFPILGELLKKNITRSKKGYSYKTGYAINQLRAKKTWLENLLPFSYTKGASSTNRRFVRAGGFIPKISKSSTSANTNFFPIHFDPFCRKKDEKKVSSNSSFKKSLPFTEGVLPLLPRRGTGTAGGFIPKFFRYKRNLLRTRKFNFFARARAPAGQKGQKGQKGQHTFGEGQGNPQRGSARQIKANKDKQEQARDHLNPRALQGRAKERTKRKSSVLPFSLSTFCATIGFARGKPTPLGFAGACWQNTYKATLCKPLWTFLPLQGTVGLKVNPLGVRGSVKNKNILFVPVPVSLRGKRGKRGKQYKSSCRAVPLRGKEGQVRYTCKGRVFRHQVCTQKFQSACFVTTLNKTKRNVCIPTINTSVLKCNLHRFKSIKHSTFLSKNNHFKSDICLRNIIPLDLSLTPVLKVNFGIEIDDEVLYLRQKIRERIVFEVWTNGSIHPRQAVHNAALSLTDMFASFRSVYQAKSSFLLFSPTSRFNKTVQTSSRLQQNDDANCMAKLCRIYLNTRIRPQEKKQLNKLQLRGIRKNILLFNQFGEIRKKAISYKYQYKFPWWQNDLPHSSSFSPFAMTKGSTKGQKKASQEKTGQQEARSESLLRKAKICTYGAAKKNMVRKVKRNNNFFYKTKFEKNSLHFSDLGESTLPINIHFFLKKKGLESISTLKSLSSFELLLFLDGNTKMFYLMKRFLLRNNFPVSL